jgi:hypothetical protein
MDKEEMEAKFNCIEDFLLDFSRGMTDLLKNSEVYFILELVKRLVRKNEEIKKFKEDKEEENNIKAAFVIKYKELTSEWNKYKLTKIKNGCNFSESFFNWLVYIKCVSYDKFKEDIREDKE